MKPQGQKTEFIRLRAEGKSYSAICAELHISKSTCSAWEKELRDAIAELKQEKFSELYTSYAMTREARIKKLGDTLNRIEDALDGKDLTELPPEKLLDYKLKYTEALKEEYIGIRSTAGRIREPEDILKAFGDLTERASSGEITSEQAKKESSVLAGYLKAYETAELKAKLEALEAILDSRK